MAAATLDYNPNIATSTYIQAGYRSCEIDKISDSVRGLFHHYASRDVDMSEMKKALSDRKVKSEVLEYKKQKIAGFVFHSQLTSSVGNLPDALYVKVLGVGNDLYRSDVSALCCRIVEVAQAQEARTIAFYCQQKGARIELLNELKENGFRVRESSNRERAIVFLLMSRDAHKPADRFEALQRKKAEYAAAQREKEEMERAAARQNLKRKRATDTEGTYNNGCVQRPMKQAKYARRQRGDSIENPIEVTLRKQYIHAIQQGKKTKEGRINSGMFKRVRTNDYLRFFYKQNRFDDVICQAEEINIYPGFKEMLKDGGVQSYLPEMPYGSEGLEKGIRLYHSIPSYRTRAAQNGVMGITLRVFGKSSQLQGHRNGGY